MLGNTELVEYGIQNEDSDIRAHVCVAVQRVYVYPTASGVEAINSGKYRKLPAYTRVNGTRIKTAEGFVIPPAHLRKCVYMPIPDHLIDRLAFNPTDSTTEKGEKAVQVITWFLRHGGFPLSVHGEVIEDQDLQVDGLDIYIRLKAKIQVKCDYNGGPKPLGGTGNLFLQVAECNPLRAH